MPAPNPVDFGAVPISEAPRPEDFGATPAGDDAHGAWNALVAGYQNSATGLTQRGRLPDVVLDPQHSKWWEKTLATAASTAADLPEMAMGAAMGGVVGGALGTAAPVVGNVAGAVVGAGAGAFAVPTAIRESLIQSYTKGEVRSSSDFLSRALIVANETAKSAITGAVTSAAGVAAKPAGSLAQGAAEVASMGTVPSALEGKLPEPEDFANAAIMVGGMHAAGRIAAKIADVYERTGIPPEQVVADARRDPAVMEGLRAAGADLPSPYKEAAARQTAHDVVPDPKADPSHALDLAAMIREPYGEIPQDKLPNYENFRYVQGPEDMQAVSARASEVFADQIQAARGTQSWDETKQQAIEFLAKRATDHGTAFTVPTSDDALVDLASRGMAAESMQQAASRAVVEAAQKVAREGATPENINAQIGAIEMVRAWTALDQTNGAEVARALNARKAAAQMRDISSGVLDGAMRYGGDHAALAQHILSLGDPQRVGRYVREIGPSTTLQKLKQYYRFALLTGATVFQVKAVGDMMATVETLTNAALRVPAAVVGSGEVGARAAEVSAMVGSIGQGVKDGMRAMIDTWKATSQPRATFGADGKPNLMDKITNIPHRIIETETDFFRALNERMEMSRQATSIAMGERFRPGTDDFSQRVTTLLQSPTKEMTAAAVQAGAEGTFTNKTSGLGKLIQDVSNDKYGEWGGFVVPFARVPVNLAAWSLKDMPVLGLAMKGNREDWAAGGAKRDGVIARQVIGGTVASLVAGAVAGGTMTGGGLSLSQDQRAARRASGIPDYSWKIGKTWYAYERFQPLGTIAIVAADLMELHQQADQAYKADLYKMTAAVMGHAILSQPYFEGMNGVIEGLNSPDKAAKDFDRATGSWIPSLMAQAASSNDPYKRRVDGLMDSIQQRIPVWRNQMLPQINPLTGEPVANPRGLGLVGTVTEGEDPVLTEAARLQVSVPRTPGTMRLPSKLDKKVGDVALTPEQQNHFTTAAGQMTHQIMEGVVDTDQWKATPDVVKKMVFEKAITAGHKVAKAEVLTPDQRASEMERIADQLQEELRK